MINGLIGESNDGSNEGYNSQSSYESDSEYSTQNTDTSDDSSQYTDTSDDSSGEESTTSEALDEETDSANLAFVEACAQGNLTAVKAHLDAGGSPNIRDSYNQIVALIEAAKNGQSEITTLLLDTDKIKVDITNRYEQTALMWSVKMGHNHIVNQLIQKGANINATNDLGDSVLIWAIDANNISATKMLIDKGASIFIKNGYETKLLFETKYRMILMPHITKLQNLADNMIARTPIKDSDLCALRKYSRHDMLKIISGKLGENQMTQAIAIYDAALNPDTNPSTKRSIDRGDISSSNKRHKEEK